MSIGDVNSNARGSGARYNDGKPDLSLIPLCLLEGEARVWMRGAKKYARNNWMKGMQWSVPFASLMRHLSAWQLGEDFDPETGEHHLDHASCNIRMLRLYADTYREGDDRPKEWLTVPPGNALDSVSMDAPIPAESAYLAREVLTAEELKGFGIGDVEPLFATLRGIPDSFIDSHGNRITRRDATRHPMHAEALRDHDERLFGGEDRL